MKDTRCGTLREVKELACDKIRWWRTTSNHSGDWDSHKFISNTLFFTYPICLSFFMNRCEIDKYIPILNLVLIKIYFFKKFLFLYINMVCIFMPSMNISVIHTIVANIDNSLYINTYCV